MHWSLSCLLLVIPERLKRGGCDGPCIKSSQTGAGCLSQPQEFLPGVCYLSYLVSWSEEASHLFIVASYQRGYLGDPLWVIKVLSWNLELFIGSYNSASNMYIL